MPETELNKANLIAILSAILLNGTGNHGPGQGEITTAVEASLRIVDTVREKLEAGGNNATLGGSADVPF